METVRKAESASCWLSPRLIFAPGPVAVRLTKGRRNTTKSYDGDPVDIARGYEEAGAQMIHIVDLDGAFSEPKLGASQDAS